MTKCPKCGRETEHDLVYKKYHVCRNKDCKGWYCFYCEDWHPFGTSCGNASLHGAHIDSQETYDKWCRNHEDDLLRMLKDSGCDMMQ